MNDELRGVMPRGNLVIATLWAGMLYLLSVGPAYYVAGEVRSARQWVRTFYAPLFWVRDNTSLDTPLKWLADNRSTTS
jgi:hypothetical protein